jgi:hypothetical protein
MHFNEAKLADRPSVRDCLVILILPLPQREQLPIQASPLEYANDLTAP